MGALLDGDESIVVSAPTGSGKTVLFELAMVRAFSHEKPAKPLAIYIGPTKALCAERARDWRTKLGQVGLKVCELTGDSVMLGAGEATDQLSSGETCSINSADLIVATPEKIDQLQGH